MKCPSCANLENRVIDSRLNKEGNSTRRRRECLSCNERFTTYDGLKKPSPILLKKTDAGKNLIAKKFYQGLRRPAKKGRLVLNKWKC